MKLKPIVEELRNECECFESRVFGIAEYAQIADSTAPEDLPAAYVIPLTETPMEPLSSTRYQQTVEFNFAVVLAISNATDEQGLNAWERADDLKKAVFAAILGSDDTGSQRDWIQYEGLSIVELNRAFLAVQLEFSCNYDIKDDETRHGKDIDRLGRFLRMYADIDVIGADGKPDGKIEAKFHEDLES